jgi:hypothetical protein
MDRETYRPRLLAILGVAIIIGQVLSINYLKKEFDEKINQCYEAVNTSSVLQGALVNILVKKKVLEKQELLAEAQQLSNDLMQMMEKNKKMQPQNMILEGEDKQEQQNR